MSTYLNFWRFHMKIFVFVVFVLFLINSYADGYQHGWKVYEKP